jgi:hypothetical protein
VKGIYVIYLYIRYFGYVYILDGQLIDCGGKIESARNYTSKKQEISRFDC